MSMMMTLCCLSSVHASYVKHSYVFVTATRSGHTAISWKKSKTALSPGDISRRIRPRDLSDRATTEEQAGSVLTKIEKWLVPKNIEGIYSIDLKGQPLDYVQDRSYERSSWEISYKTDKITPTIYVGDEVVAVAQRRSDYIYQDAEVEILSCGEWIPGTFLSKVKRNMYKCRYDDDGTETLKTRDEIRLPGEWQAAEVIEKNHDTDQYTVKFEDNSTVALELSKVWKARCRHRMVQYLHVVNLNDTHRDYIHIQDEIKAYTQGIILKFEEAIIPHWKAVIKQRVVKCIMGVDFKCDKAGIVQKVSPQLQRKTAVRQGSKILNVNGEACTKSYIDYLQEAGKADREVEILFEIVPAEQ